MKLKRITAFLTAAALLSGGLMYNPSEKTNIISAASTSDYSKTTEGFVTRMYNVVLNRNPDSSGLNSWVTKLNNHTMSASDIINGFFNSQEYQGKKKSIEDQVSDCYQAMLGRKPDAKGQQDWSEKMSVGMTINAVCKGFVGSQEFKNLCSTYGIEPGNMELKNSRDKNFKRTYFVYRLYDNCLCRQPDTAGLESWCKKLENGTTGSQIASGFLLSKEFKGAHYDNIDYVYIMYITMLGREPDAAGLENWVNKLNYSDTREKVANGFIFSNEFKAQCNEAGISPGNKITEKDSSQAWKYNIEILNLINNERTARGLDPLATRQDLWEDVAMVRTSEIVQKFTHDRPDGSSCFTAYEQSGIHYWNAGENIAAGYPGPAEVVNGWMNSSGHRANILNPDFDTVATGYVYASGTMYRYYYSQNFML